MFSSTYGRLSQCLQQRVQNGARRRPSDCGDGEKLQLADLYELYVNHSTKIKHSSNVCIYMSAERLKSD